MTIVVILDSENKLCLMFGTLSASIVIILLWHLACNFQTLFAFSICPLAMYISIGFSSFWISYIYVSKCSWTKCLLVPATKTNYSLLILLLHLFAGWCFRLTNSTGTAWLRSYILNSFQFLCVPIRYLELFFFISKFFCFSELLRDNFCRTSCTYLWRFFYGKFNS